MRQKKEAEAAAAKRQREAELRKQHLASIMQRADTIWSGLDALMDQKIASAYDQAAAQLQEMRDAYAQAGDHQGLPAEAHRISTSVLKSSGYAAPDRETLTMARKPIQIDRDKLRAAVRKLGNEYVFYMLEDAIELLPPSKLHKIAKKYLDLRRLLPDAELADGTELARGSEAV